MTQAVTKPALTKPAPAVTPSQGKLRRGIFPMIVAGAALAVAAVSGAFSIVGLTAVFTGAFWPIIAMGGALETAKVVAVAWLGRHRSAGALRAAVTGLVVTLMGLNIIGAYGFLAKAHLDHAVAFEERIADHSAHVEARRALAAANVADIDRQIGAIDTAVNETIRRGRTVSAMSLAEQQAGRRDALVAERAQAARSLADIRIEESSVESERSGLEAGRCCTCPG